METDPTEPLDFWLARLDRFTRPGFVYIIEAEGTTAIKIGRAKKPRTRLATLQTGSPVKLHFLHLLPGGDEMERALHARLAPARAMGEWFDGAAVPEFLEWFAGYCVQETQRYWDTGDPPRVPDPLPDAPVTRGKTRRARMASRSYRMDRYPNGRAA